MLSQRQDREYHETLWDMYRTLVPVKYRENITGFGLITDGYDGVVAHVMPSIDDPRDWLLSLDVLDSGVNIDEVMKTLIHETAHVLTIGHKQVPVDRKYLEAFDEEKDISSYRNKCKTVFVKNGCARKLRILTNFIMNFGNQLSKSGQKEKVEESEIEFFIKKSMMILYGTTNVTEDIRYIYSVHFTRFKK